MPESHSKIAIALAEAICPSYVVRVDNNQPITDDLATIIDARLAEVRKAYEPEELARCPIITHHPKDAACAFCCCAAMRAFILLPE